MSNLKEIRTRIASVSSTQQITSAMKMVSAAKFKKAQDAIIQLRPYANKLNDILIDIIDSLQGNKSNIYYRQSKIIKKVLFVVITSNRGLCGAFNANVIRKVISLANEEYPSQRKMGLIDLYIIGKKGGDALKRRDFNIIKTRNDVYENLNFENASIIAEEIMQRFVSLEYDHIDIIYNQFRNAAVQELTAEQFLPVTISRKDKLEKERKKKYDTFANFIFEPSQENIVEELIPRSLKTLFYKAILDSYASEHGARMTTMHKATDNAADLIKDLTLEYNKARQASITKEILEIVSGAESLRNQ